MLPRQSRCHSQESVARFLSAACIRRKPYLTKCHVGRCDVDAQHDAARILDRLGDFAAHCHDGPDETGRLACKLRIRNCSGGPFQVRRAVVLNWPPGSRRDWLGLVRTSCGLISSSNGKFLRAQADLCRIPSGRKRRYKAQARSLSQAPRPPTPSCHAPVSAAPR